MDCNATRPLLQAYLDRETGLEQSLSIEAHLAQCAGCRAQLQNLRDWRALLRTAPRYRAPAALRAQLLQTLSEAPQGSGEPMQPEAAPILSTAPDDVTLGAPIAAPGLAAPRRRVVRLRGAAIAFASAASVLLLLGLGGYLRLPTPNNPLLAQLVTAHVHSQLANHLIDVVSSDQHTVRPWFNGRSDIAPPAVDLAAQGYALAGGRLDYIDGRNVPVLVYRYREHVLNVFVLPAQASDTTPPQLDSLQGFRLLHWQQGGLALWAVSDASESTLRGFAEALRQATR